jgi:hypothetical protein
VRDAEPVSVGSTTRRSSNSSVDGGNPARHPTAHLA